jgi:hypothetical protein
VLEFRSKASARFGDTGGRPGLDRRQPCHLCWRHGGDAIGAKVIEELRRAAVIWDISPEAVSGRTGDLSGRRQCRQFRPLDLATIAAVGAAGGPISAGAD